MMKQNRLFGFVALFAFTFAAAALAPEAALRVIIDTTQPGPVVSPMMHGVFFEDINYGADGGLYA